MRIQLGLKFSISIIVHDRIVAWCIDQEVYDDYAGLPRCAKQISGEVSTTDGATIPNR